MSEAPNDMQQNTGQKRAAAVALVVLVVVIAAALVAYRALVAAQPAQQEVEAEPYAFATDPSGAAPDVTVADTLACRIFDSAGEQVLLGDVMQGRPTVVNVWATWCPYCVDEMADFQAMFERHGDEVQFVMLDVSDSSHEMTEARSYVAEQGYTFPVYYDAAHEFTTLYGVFGLPTTVVLDADGTTLLVQAGRVDSDRMEFTVSEL